MHPPTIQAASHSFTLRIENLPLYLTASDLLYVFQRIVTSDERSVFSTQIMREVSGDSKGFGFVYLRGIGMGDEVLKELMIKTKGLMIEGNRVTMQLHDLPFISESFDSGAKTSTSTSIPLSSPNLMKNIAMSQTSHDPPPPPPPSDVHTPPNIISLTHLFSLPISQIWLFLNHQSTTNLVRSFGIEQTDNLVRECTEDWVVGFVERGEEGIDRMRVEVERKVGGMMKAWGFKSHQRKIGLIALRSEDPSSLIYLLNCHPDLLKGVVRQRLSMSVQCDAGRDEGITVFKV